MLLNVFFTVGNRRESQRDSSRLVSQSVAHPVPWPSPPSLPFPPFLSVCAPHGVSFAMH